MVARRPGRSVRGTSAPRHLPEGESPQAWSGSAVVMMVQALLSTSGRTAAARPRFRDNVKDIRLVRVEGLRQHSWAH
jgi:glycogen debranching enzyme